MSNILLTGHSGFLGSHIKTFLRGKDYNLINLGRSKDSDIICDLGNETFQSKDIDYVIHVAGKAHSIPENQAQIDEFYKVNYEGTKNLIHSIGNLKIKTFIFISTVAVYGKETGELIDEISPLLGDTPYSLSKIKAEQALLDFSKAKDVKLVILRLPLITGEGAVGNLNSIIKAIKKGYYFRIGKGDAKRSIIAAVDVAEVMPELFEIEGTYNYTDCIHPKISEIDTVISMKYNKKVQILPFFLMKLISNLGEILPFFPFNKIRFKKLTKTLTFSNEKILNQINYKPLKGLSEIT